MTTLTTTLAERAAKELAAILAQFAAGEAEVVRAYFGQPHSSEENLDVLLRQMGREIWNHPLSPQRLAAIDRGQVASFDPHVEL